VLFLLIYQQHQNLVFKENQQIIKKEMSDDENNELAEDYGNDAGAEQNETTDNQTNDEPEAAQSYGDQEPEQQVEHEHEQEQEHEHEEEQEHEHEQEQEQEHEQEKEVPKPTQKPAVNARSEMKESKESEPRANVYHGKASKQANTTIAGNIPTDLTPETAWRAVSADPPSINWYLFTVDKKLDLTFKQAGQNGLKEFINVLKSSSAELLFGLLRVNTNDRGGTSMRAKFVFVRFVGSKVGVMQKAKLTPKLGKIGDAFPVKHLSYDLNEEVTNFTIEALSKEMVRVGGVHESFDFGPDQIYICK